MRTNGRTEDVSVRGTGMGAWGERAFDNDTANDWAYDLDGVDDLSLVESALSGVEAVGSGSLDQVIPCLALAACEVLARLRGAPGYKNAYTKKVDLWVTAHPLSPSPPLLTRARACIDRVLGEKSELRELWSEDDPTEWNDAVADLRERLG